MNRRKEIAKFLSGAKAFHALAHTYFWISGTTLTVFGITQTPALNAGAAIGNAVLSIVLGVYAWKPSGPGSR